MDFDYIDNSCSRRREWTQSRLKHRQKLADIESVTGKLLVASPDRKNLASRSRQRFIGMLHTDLKRIQVENATMFSKLSEVTPQITVKEI